MRSGDISFGFLYPGYLGHLIVYLVSVAGEKLLAESREMRPDPHYVRCQVVSSKKNCFQPFCDDPRELGHSAPLTSQQSVSQVLAAGSVFVQDAPTEKGRCLAQKL